MIKKVSKIMILTMMCVMMSMSTVNAADASFSFTLGNTGTSYNRISDKANKKKYIKDDWSIKVTKTNCVGPYGISFCLYNTSTSKKCTRSAAWVNKVSKKPVAFASGDAALVNYKLCARQDDDYYQVFTASGYFNADNTCPK